MVTKIGALLIALQLSGGVALAAPPPPSPAVARIQSVTHDARIPLSAGKHLTVRLTGTPGGMGRFHIAGVAAGIGMRELPSRDPQTATYTGTYVIRPGDAAALAAITATLRVGGREVISASSRPVIIDARPPEITHRLPQPDAVVSNLRPNVVLRFFDGESSVDPTRVRLLIDGRDVTGKTALTSAFAAYTPGEPFRPGPVRVQAVVGDRAGNVTRAAWTFVVAPPPGLIDSVTVSPAAGLKPGDYLTVVMIGAPGGQAAFTDTRAPRSIPMRESAQTPGRYFGLLPIGFKDQGRFVQVAATLRKGNRFSTAPAVVTVPVLGLTPRPTVASPSKPVLVGGHVNEITVRGSAVPSSRIIGLLSARATASSGNNWTPIVTASASTHREGTWRLSLGPFVPWPQAALFLTLVAIDPLGQRSPPVIVALGEALAAAEEEAPPATGETQQTVQDSPAEVQQVSAPPPPPPPPPPTPSPTPAQSSRPASCSGRVDEASGQCVVTEVHREDRTTDNSGTKSPSDPPAVEPPAPDPPSEPKPKAPGKPKDDDD